jgi:hypothetical protein
VTVPSNDACAAWCVSEKFDTGACYGDPKLLRICVCESPCHGEAHGALTPHQVWLGMLS